MKREKIIKIATGKALLSITLFIFTSAKISNAQIVFDEGGLGGGLNIQSVYNTPVNGYGIADVNSGIALLETELDISLIPIASFDYFMNDAKSFKDSIYVVTPLDIRPCYDAAIEQKIGDYNIVIDALRPREDFNRVTKLLMLNILVAQRNRLIEFQKELQSVPAPMHESLIKGELDDPEAFNYFIVLAESLAEEVENWKNLSYIEKEDIKSRAISTFEEFNILTNNWCPDSLITAKNSLSGVRLSWFFNFLGISKEDPSCLDQIKYFETTAEEMFNLSEKTDEIYFKLIDLVENTREVVLNIAENRMDHVEISINSLIETIDRLDSIGSANYIIKAMEVEIREVLGEIHTTINTLGDDGTLMQQYLELETFYNNRYSYIPPEQSSSVVETATVVYSTGGAMEWQSSSIVGQELAGVVVGDPIGVETATVVYSTGGAMELQSSGIVGQELATVAAGDPELPGAQPTAEIQVGLSNILPKTTSPAVVAAMEKEFNAMGVTVTPAEGDMVAVTLNNGVDRATHADEAASYVLGSPPATYANLTSQMDGDNTNTYIMTKNELAAIGITMLYKDVDGNPELGQGLLDLAQVINNDYERKFRKILPALIDAVRDQKKLSIKVLANQYGVSIEVVKQIDEIINSNSELLNSEIQVTAENIKGPIGNYAIRRGEGFVTLAGNGNLHLIEIKSFIVAGEDAIDKLVQKTGVSKNILNQLQRYILNNKNIDGTFVLPIIIVGEEKKLLVCSIDTIVYINSTNPTEIAKEVIKRVLIKRPDASSAVVNRIFLFMVVVGLICIGFGITLAVYIAKAQIKRSEYFSPTLGAEKSFQHNYAASWKTR